MNIHGAYPLRILATGILSIFFFFKRRNPKHLRERECTIIQL